MTVTAVVGLQWGDEAKGKFVDLLAKDADIVARFNGGDNAGHTVVNDYGTFKLRLTPNGLLNPKTTCVIGPGVVVNLDTLIKESVLFQNSGLDLTDRLWISPRCHIVMPYHPILEGIYEQAKGSSRTGTTKRGMGPVFADKVSYNGIRLYDLENEEVFAEKLRIQLAIKNPILKAFEIQELVFEQVFQEKLEQYRQLSHWVREPYGLIQDLLASNGDLLLEGAQGALLDNQWGTYPYCTASTTLSGGASAGLGLPPKSIENVVGIAKAYTTRVGAGPMPTEDSGEIGKILLEEGAEYGTVTHRPRRCGWLDAELVRFTCQINGVIELALTKLDVLDKLPILRIGIGYRHPDTPDQLHHYWQGDTRWLEACQPKYIEMEGWQQETKDIRSYEQLPQNAKAYIKKVEELTNTPIRYISVGPERDATIQVW
jgi:adenylosuccinate synthase